MVDVFFLDDSPRVSGGGSRIAPGGSGRMSCSSSLSPAIYVFFGFLSDRDAASPVVVVFPDESDTAKVVPFWLGWRRRRRPYMGSASVLALRDEMSLVLGREVSLPPSPLQMAKGTTGCNRAIIVSGGGSAFRCCGAKDKRLNARRVL